MITRFLDRFSGLLTILALLFSLFALVFTGLIYSEAKDVYELPVYSPKPEPSLLEVDASPSAEVEASPKLPAKKPSVASPSAK